MSAFEKYEQMRKAAEAAQQPGVTPETGPQRSRRLLEESGTRRAMDEILEGIPQHPHSRLVENLDGSIEAQFGASETHFNSVRAVADLHGSRVHIHGSVADIPFSPPVHQREWETDHDRVDASVARAFMRPEERWLQPTPPRPAPTPPPPPEIPKGRFRRAYDRFFSPPEPKNSGSSGSGYPEHSEPLQGR